METKEIKIECPEGYEIDKERSSFEKIVFKKKDGLPKTWDEYLSKYRHRDYYITINTELPIKLEYVSAFKALAKLIELRDYYNSGWKPIWKNTSHHCIFYSDEEIRLGTRNAWRCVLVFKSRELRDEFYNNFKDLIEQAKELL